MEIRETDLRIAGPDGVERRYVTTPLPFDAAYMLGLKLAEMIGGTLGAGLAALLGGEDHKGLDAQFTPRMGSEVGKALAGLPRELLSGGPALLDEILAGTWVAGKDSGGHAMKIRLNDAKGRAHAWGGGLSPEPFRVIAWIMQVNYGPLWTGASPAWGALSKLAQNWLTDSGLTSGVRPETASGETASTPSTASSA